MSFAQQLGKTAVSAQENFFQETVRKFTTECQRQAAQGHSRCDIDIEKPQWFPQVKQRFEEKLKEMGFEASGVHDYGKKFQLYARWKLD